MEDPLRTAQRAVYTRVSDRSLSGLFTRPAILALADETRGILPTIALNQVCRRLMDADFTGDKDVSGIVNCIASEAGFNNMEQFAAMFQAATGWQPDEWCRSYCRDTMPRRNRL